MNVQIRVHGRPRAKVSLKALKRVATRLLAALGLANTELSIVVCDDSTIRELNRAYRKKDRPTDVLAYAAQEALWPHVDVHVGRAVHWLGDVVISADTAVKQARERGRSVDEEAQFLLTHGLLHLLGFDHQTRNEERRMCVGAHGSIAQHLLIFGGFGGLAAIDVDDPL